MEEGGAEGRKERKRKEGKMEKERRKGTLILTHFSTRHNCNYMQNNNAIQSYPLYRTCLANE